MTGFVGFGAAALASMLVSGSMSSCAPAPPPAPSGGYTGPPGAYEAAGSESGSEAGPAGPDAELGPADPTYTAADGDLAAAPEGEPGDAPPPEAEATVEPAAARRPAGMSQFEAGVAAAAARLRRDPAWLVAALTRYRERYRGRRLYLPGVDAAILTVEGVAAVDEALAAARRVRPRPGLRLSPGLSRAARDHAREIGRAGTLDHNGRDGSEPHQRMARHGRVGGLSGENIGTGWGDAEAMVLALFVDDGVRSRGHRVNLLEPEYRAVGVGCAPHRQYGTVCVMDLAGEFRE